MRRRIIFVIVFFLGIALAGSAFFVWEKAKNDQFSRELATGQIEHYQGNFEAAVDRYAKAAESAPTKHLRAKADLKRAFELYMRNQGDDRKQSLLIYKDIAFDESQTPFLRTWALTVMLDLFAYLKPDQELLSRHVFSELEANFPGEGFDAMTARLYELADQIYPSPLARFGAARAYVLMLVKSAYHDETERRGLIAKVKEWTEKGEEIIPLTLKDYDRVLQAYIYRLAGERRVALGRLKGAEDNYAKAEEHFKSALALLAPEDQFYLYGEGLLLRLPYSIMLADVYGESRRTDVEALLEPVVNPPEHFKDSRLLFYELLDEVQPGKITADHRTESIIRLKNFSPQFATFLESRGLQY